MSDLPIRTDPELRSTTGYDPGTDHIPTTRGSVEVPGGDRSSRRSNGPRQTNDRPSRASNEGPQRVGREGSDRARRQAESLEAVEVSGTGAGEASAEQGDRPRPPQAALGSTQSLCWGRGSEVNVDPVVLRRRQRWAARSALWSASTLFPVRTCGRTIAQVRASVDGSPVRVDREAIEVRRKTIDGRPVAGLGGLTLCGSVWACPRCAAVIAVQRSAEIARAVERCQNEGGTVHFLTLTLRHRRRDELAEAWRVLQAGWRGVTGSVEWTGRKARCRNRDGREWEEPGVIGDRERFGVAGLVRVIEATVSRPGEGHGWHLHIHALLFAEDGLEGGLACDWRELLGGDPPCTAEWLARHALGSRVRARWCSAVVRAGGRVPGVAAVDLRQVTDGAAEYVGGYLAKSTYEVATRIGAEAVSGAVTKDAMPGNLTPFALLAEAIESESFGFRTPRNWVIEAGLRLVDRETGEITDLAPPPLWRRWIEWERASRGRHQIDWSRRPKTCASNRDRLWMAILDARGASAAESDESLAHGGLRDGVLGEISRDAWYGNLVWHPAKIARVLETAEEGGSERLASWMSAEGINYRSI